MGTAGIEVAAEGGGGIRVTPEGSLSLRYTTPEGITAYREIITADGRFSADNLSAGSLNTAEINI
jgi:hypothetical protein